MPVLPRCGGGGGAGLLLWVELPRGLDTLQLHQACLQERILVPPGTVFGTGGRFRNCLRIGVGGDWTEHHAAALRRVGAIACAMGAKAGHSEKSLV
ncbi:hypothetical protein [Paracidovorax oryzae]|uniref:hypothetical protein n=1 Tax=Paracidovorax oryzae TaxID=862720 RepID=UPI001ED949FE|nr:hypothetical protein [Paracidovorax oryzae]